MAYIGKGRTKELPLRKVNFTKSEPTFFACELLEDSFLLLYTEVTDFVE